VKRSAVETPRVSVAIQTFNQAPYVRRMLDSVLAQETDFAVQAVVHDDASTDGTREIIKSYAAAHPDRIEPLLQDENQFSQGRRIFPLIWPHLRGEYIAMLDGDDMWTDPRKLAVQARFLDDNPRCALCQTRSAYVNDATGEKIRSFPPPHRSRRRHRLDDLAAGNFIQTSAVMFRAAALPEGLPEGFDDLPFGDYALFALLARRGWIGLIDEEMTLYRIHQSNYWVNRAKTDTFEPTQKVRAFVLEHLDPRDREPWREVLGLTPPPRSFRDRALRAARRRLRRLGVR
jgi:glycosyltransferase involved in cell wall biosynthesis